MTEERTKGVINTAKGDLKAGVGKLTGDRKLQAKGQVQQLQGKAQKGLGDLQDTVRKTRRDRG